MLLQQKTPIRLPMKMRTTDVRAINCVDMQIVFDFRITDKTMELQSRRFE